MSTKDLSGKVFLTRTEVQALGITGSNVTWLRREQRGLMPRRIRIGGTRVCWDRAEIMRMIEDCRSQRARDQYAHYK